MEFVRMGDQITFYRNSHSHSQVLGDIRLAGILQWRHVWVTPSAVNLDLASFPCKESRWWLSKKHIFIFCTYSTATNSHLENYVYYTSGRSLAFSGNTFSAPSTVYGRQRCHTIDGISDGSGLFNGCYFDNVSTLVDLQIRRLTFNCEAADPPSARHICAITVWKMHMSARATLATMIRLS